METHLPSSPDPSRPSPYPLLTVPRYCSFFRVTPFVPLPYHEIAVAMPVL
jgi:hypothetical protein